MSNGFNRKEIVDKKGVLLAVVISVDHWPRGTHFHTLESSAIQVATMRHDEGEHKRAHKHNVYERVATRTNETMFIRYGRLRAIIYDDNGDICGFFHLEQGDVAIFLAGGHSFDFMEDDTEILEVKNGPFESVEKDKTFLEDER